MPPQGFLAGEPAADCASPRRPADPWRLWPRASPGPRTASLQNLDKTL